MKAIFVTGTDTEVGKTVISGLLGRYLLDKGHSVITQKWIQTGSRAFPKDIASHLKLMNRKKEDVKDYLPYVSAYTFSPAASPHLAAKLEKRAIRSKKIKNSFNLLAGQFDFVIVEGVGGVLVPFNEEKLVIDIAVDLNIPILIVAANKLGAINHTLLTIEAIKSRKMRILGIVFNNVNKNRNALILEDNPRIIGKISRERVFGILPYMKDRERLYKSFRPIGEKIHTTLKTYQNDPFDSAQGHPERLKGVEGWIIG